MGRVRCARGQLARGGPTPRTEGSFRRTSADEKPTSLDRISDYRTAVSARFAGGVSPPA
jgi:hypothetical protein